jgi:hypothetical protein
MPAGAIKARKKPTNFNQHQERSRSFQSYQSVPGRLFHYRQGEVFSPDVHSFFPGGHPMGPSPAGWKKYEMNYSVKQYVEQSGEQLKTPWWSFSGLILAGVIALIAAFN